METLEDFMNKLREQYEGLGLTDEQIVKAASNGITPEQIKTLREGFKNFIKVFNEIFEKAASFFSQLAESEDFQKLFSNLENETKNIQRNKKGKKLRPWENKKFYQ